MALTLSNARTSLAPSAQADLQDPERAQFMQDLAVQGPSEVEKGWRSSGLSGRANELYTQALKAGIDGRHDERAVLESQAQDLDQQAAVSAPRVQNVTDVRSLRDAADWVGGALGGVRTSVAPAVGGLVGAGVGAVAAPFTGGVVNPVNAGFAGASAMGYDAETDEAVAAAMRDPYIRANHTYEEILAASRVKGGLNSLLEAAVPTVMGGKVAGTLGKGAVGRFFGKAATGAELEAERLAQRTAQQAIVSGGRAGAAKAVGKSVLEGGAGEFVTEGTQSLVGQGAQNYLQDQPLDNLDYTQAFNEGMAGAVAGGGMGTIGGAGDVGHAYLGAVREKVDTVRKDPVGAAADFVADAGSTVGKAAAKGLDWLERQGSPELRAYDTLVEGRGATDEQHQAAATQWAQHVLESRDSTESERKDAQDFVTRLSNGDKNAAAAYRDKLTVGHLEGRIKDSFNSISDDIESTLPKQSKVGMTVEGELSSRLSDLWLSTEGKNIGLFKRGGNTPEAKRTALMLTAWVRSGFGAAHNDGETFIPTKLVDELGDDAAKAVMSLAKLVKRQGVFQGDGKALLKMHDELRSRAQDNTSDSNIIDQFLLPLSDAHWSDNRSKVLSTMLREKGGKVSDAVRKNLEKDFGPNTDALLKHFRDKPVTPKYGKKVDTHSGEDYDSGLTVNEGGERVVYHGYNRTDRPFNMLHEGQVKAHSKRMSTHQNDGAVYARSVGAHDMVIEQFGKDHEYLRQAEDDVLWRAVKQKDSTDADREAYMQHLDSLEDTERRSLLKALNKSHKFIRVEQVSGNEVADQIRPDQVNKFRETRKPDATDVTPEHGMLYLERKAKVDEDTGEAVGKDEAFLTSTHRLIRHVWDAEKKESEGGADTKGVAKTYEAFKRGLAALIQSDGTFTGRVGFRMAPEEEGDPIGPVRWIKRGSILPGELVLRSKKATPDSEPVYETVEQAEQKRASDLKAGMPMNFELAEVDTVAEKRAELLRLRAADIPYPLQLELDGVLFAPADPAYDTRIKEKGAKYPKGRKPTTRQSMRTTPRDQIDSTQNDEAVSELYDRLNEEWNSEPSEPGDEIQEATDKNVTPSEHAREREIHRNDDDGSRAGLADDAIGAGYEGHARTSGVEPVASRKKGDVVADKRVRNTSDASAAEPMSAPLATVDSGVMKNPTEQQRGALVRIEAARDWVVSSMANKDNYEKMLVEVRGMTAGQLEVFTNAIFGVTNSDTFETRKAVNKKRGKQERAEFDIVPTGDTHTTTSHAAGLLDMSGRGIGDTYFKGDTNRGTMRITRLKYYSEAIKQAISDREEVLKNGVETTEGTPTGRSSEDRESGRVASRENAKQSETITSDQLDDAIYKEDYANLDTVEKLQQFAKHVYQRFTELEKRDADGDTLTEREEGVSALAEQLVFDAKKYVKNPNGYGGMDFDSFFDGLEHTDADVETFVKSMVGVKKSAQTADRGNGKRATKDERDAAKKHILDTIGDTVKGAFVEHFGDNSSGSWTPGNVQNVIRLALNSDVLSTSYHESMHEFFDMLKKHGNEATVKLLERVASNEVLNRKIERLLAEHPAAAAQVRSSPEEAAAFMYQFWQTGQLKLGEEVGGFFNRIKRFINTLRGKVSKEVRDEREAEAVLRAFSGGAFKSTNGDTAVRDASMVELRKNTEAHNKVLENLDKAGRDFVRIAGKPFFSAAAMMQGTKNEDMVSILADFNQEAGTAKGEKQALFDAIKQQDGIWMNRLNNILTAYSKEDLELARMALSTGTPAKDRVAKEIVEKINTLNDELFNYISSRKVSRWDDEAGKWLPVEKRKNYFTRVWDTSELQNRAVEFRDRLLKVHMKELEATAAIANTEMQNYIKGTGDYANLGPAAQAEVEKSLAAFNASGKVMGKLAPQTITAEMVADAILHRLLGTKGHIDLAETESSIGMSPVATSINRRTLSWIDDKQFEDFKSKDIANILTSYVSSMVKRAEYTNTFGNGSEKLKTKADRAVLREMGGKELVEKAERLLPLAIKQWGKAKEAARKAGAEFNEPFPTLRAVGQKAHNTAVGDENGHADLTKALKTLDQGFKAIMAMEGTLGANISHGTRQINNVLMTYQTVRLLPLVMFSSINDVMGIVANGGELSDAWGALVSGMKEIKLRWGDKKSTDGAAQRAEIWGTVDAGNFMDTLGQTYGSMWMSDKFRRISDSFFKWNGMEGWNRAMRIKATAVAERVIKSMQKEGIDTKDAAQVARLEALFGKGFKTGDIKLDANGDLDTGDVNNQAAVMRWVSNAIMSPNAAHRTIWGSDPHMASFWMLKQFAYTFHRVMLKGALEQAKLGNYRPVMTLMLGYAPVTIAADAVKELLVPGDEPPWMQGGLDDFLRHGVDRAGVMGVPGLGYDALTSFNGPVVGSLSALGGPTVGQMLSVPFDSAGKTALGAAPFGSLLRRAAD